MSAASQADHPTNGGLAEQSHGGGHGSPVDDHHVKVVPVVLLHLPRPLDDVLQLVVVHLLQVVHLPTLQLKQGACHPSVYFCKLLIGGKNL